MGRVCSSPPPPPRRDAGHAVEPLRCSAGSDGPPIDIRSILDGPSYRGPAATGLLHLPLPCPRRPQSRHIFPTRGESEANRVANDGRLQPRGAIDDIRGVEGYRHGVESTRKMSREATATDGRWRRLTSHSTATAERVEHHHTTANDCQHARPWRRSPSWPHEVCAHVTSGSAVRPRPHIPACAPATGAAAPSAAGAPPGGRSPAATPPRWVSGPPVSATAGVAPAAWSC
jgi:hypothetical protein